MKKYVWVSIKALMLVGAALFAADALAQLDQWQEQHFDKQASAGYRILTLVAFLIGATVVVVSLVSITLLALGKAPPQLEQIGVPKLLIASLVGGALMGIAGLFGGFTSTATGGEIDNDTFERLNGSFIFDEQSVEGISQHSLLENLNVRVVG